jgi:hypothetical protein
MVLGAEHHDTLISINNLASLLYNQGKMDEAEPLYRRCLAVKEKVLGAEHPSTLLSMYNLARRSLKGYASRGYYARKEKIKRRTTVTLPSLFLKRSVTE